MDGWKERKERKRKRKVRAGYHTRGWKDRERKGNRKYRETLAAKVHRLVDAPSLPLLPTTAEYKGKKMKKTNLDRVINKGKKCDQNSEKNTYH